MIHLVRDPRGMMSSIDEFGNSVNPAYRCNTMTDDLELEHLVGPGRYIRIRYEDLVYNTTNVLKDIYSFLKIPYTKQQEESVHLHMHASNNSIIQVLDHKNNNNRDKTYKLLTLRNSNFNPNSWQQRLSVETIRTIERDCKRLMKVAGYPRFEPISQQER